MNLLHQSLGYGSIKPVQLNKVISVACREPNTPYSSANISNGIANFTTDLEDAIHSIRLNIIPRQDGQGEPSPENVRPISGWSGAELYSTGKNIFNKNDYRSIHGHFDTYPSGTIVAGSGHAIISIPCRPGQTYTASRLRTVANERFAIAFCQDEPNIGSEYTNAVRAQHSGVVGEKMTLTATAPEGAYYLAVWAWWSSSVDPQDSLQVELGSIATDYTPFTGEKEHVNLRTEAGAVYGGTLDVTTGLLTVDRVLDTFKGSSIIASGVINNMTYAATRRSYAGLSLSESDAVCNAYKPIYGSDNPAYGGFYFVSTTNRLTRFFDERFTDIYTAKAIFDEKPVTICYRIINPINYQLTPVEVTTLLGVNNIWADCGPVTEVLY